MKVQGSGSQRLALVDAFRGIAALSVVVYHIYKQNLLRVAREPFIEPLHSIFVNGYLGVYVFFVLSGFVIALSLEGAYITPSFIGRFALRRSLRLDPPYWAAIVAAIIFTLVSNRAFPAHQIAVPSATDVLAHIFYLQQFVGVPHILGVFWTLCLEIQFYLVFILMMYAVQRLVGGRVWIVFGPLWIGSLAIGVANLWQPLFAWAWPFFFLGAVTAWHVSGRISTRAWLLVIAGSCVMGASGVDGGVERIAVAVVTAGILLLASRRAHASGGTLLQSLTLGRVMQYLGRISYSLYLTHLLVGSKGTRLVMRLLGNRQLGFLPLVAILVGWVLASILVAHLMHVLVELPAHRLSRRIRLVRQPRAAEQAAA